MSNNKRIIEFIDNLPSTAEPITNYKGKPLAPIYYFDTLSQRIIKQDKSRSIHPYRFIRSNKITLLFRNFKTEDIQTKDLISHLINHSN